MNRDAGLTDYVDVGWTDGEYFAECEGGSGSLRTPLAAIEAEDGVKENVISDGSRLIQVGVR